MKLRLLPVAITLVVSSAVLFGGWFMYQAVAMEDPFLESIAAVPGVESPELELGREAAVVRFTLSPDANLREAVQDIAAAAESSLGGRAVAMQPVGQPSRALDDWWAGALFDVAQAMETRQYSLIPERLNALASQSPSDIQVVTEMDDVNVYITISNGENRKYVVLPRTPAMMGVWPNE
ncbi:hypothetical protein [Paenibacillus sp.]|uniref:hypothetical protein n=1 Tax=Paenibacillus sp. TaxID=58172 RepID=UPI002D6D8D46|nr:hypothetical protein [Paenibacillus sp.]HZG85286.1 hypothetical protein [Paenibacillus sp.]